MADVLSRFNSGKLWDFKGGIHPPEMKDQSNHQPIRILPLSKDFYIPLKQHSGQAGNVLVNVGDYVLKGQALTQGDGLRVLPVHAPTSGTIKNIAPYVAAHPSGLDEMTIHLQADGLDQHIEQHPIEDFLHLTAEQLIEKIYLAGIAGLGGAVFPTAAKIQSADKKVKLLIINGAECEPYITCDDRLMREHADEIIEGVRILRYILRPEKVVIAIEDNKPNAIEAINAALHGANDIDVRVIPTKYPSGAAKQLIYLLTGMEVPSGSRSSNIGVLMHNVGTAFAIKRAVINDEPLIERVVTLTGDKIQEKGNYWVRLGTPIYHALTHTGYQFDERFPVFVGGPMMGLELPNLNAPVTKIVNCLLAPDHFEYTEPEPEKACIRCSSCSDACPVNLMPQQLYWFARSEDHTKSEEYALKDCIECGVCAYVCPSHIPLIQYFRQEKAKIWQIKEKQKKAEEAKIRFEAKQARMEREEQERKARSQRAAEARREELAKTKGEDPVKAALARLKAKKAGSEEITQQKTLTTEKGEILPDNSDITALRKARRLARQQTEIKTEHLNNSEETASENPKKVAVAAAIARAKAKKLAQANHNGDITTENVEQETGEKPTALDPKKATVAAAIARAKAKKLAQTNHDSDITTENAEQKTDEKPTALDPKKAAVAAAIARAKAKKLAQTNHDSDIATENAEQKTDEKPTALDPKKAAVAAAIARAKAKKLAQTNHDGDITTESVEQKTDEKPTALAPKKAAVAAAIARAKAKKLAQTNHDSDITTENAEQETGEKPTALDPKKAAVAAAIARAKAKKLAQAQQKSDNAQE
ncbi:electron transport complex subunit RsxC [Rodentibacter caecimuris]|uniref:Ion-translocating oxidoreductase complex subunit C n=2 Tax=Rodentibacter caecimuris TaxID=1796644 RepID=A0AAJ3K388_9PAST|nr:MULTISPECIES: electron transport complex subunit RsxC [Pasteurellaceae]MCR1836783.1 electron transport complex subunit RsxC [Pasteurella caecimuris]MCU0106002.1 electron transport complex subunit RsxC [Pasteurella caecimuris]OOF72198.1 electron transport complex subunit RsxC [Rodentibacter heylii]OOF75142.1 electron transport complex subunit RsxC [Rodentibacter heylii]